MLQRILDDNGINDSGDEDYDGPQNDNSEIFLRNLELDYEMATNPQLDDIYRDQREQLKRDLLKKGINLDYEIKANP